MQVDWTRGEGGIVRIEGLGVGTGDEVGISGGLERVALGEEGLRAEESAGFEAGLVEWEHQRTYGFFFGGEPGGRRIDAVYVLGTGRAPTRHGSSKKD